MIRSSASLPVHEIFAMLPPFLLPAACPTLRRLLLPLWLTLLCCLAGNAGAVPVIVTIAGQGSGGDGGAAVSASLDGPADVAVDAAGNVYIADNGNHRLRKITAATGLISTIAGTGTPLGSSADGLLATEASLTQPVGVAVDGAGNVYFVDYEGSLRKISAATGRLSTLMRRDNTCAGDGGPALAAGSKGVGDIVLDASGNIYFADANCYVVRKIDAVTGIVSRVAGNGIGAYSGDGGLATSAALMGVGQLALDGSGNLYIATYSDDDYDDLVVRRVDAVTGNISRFAIADDSYEDSGDGGPASAAGITSIAGMVADTLGNVYLSSGGGYRVRRIDAGTGIITTLTGNGTNASTGDGGPATAAQIGLASGLAIDAAGDLYFAEYGASKVRKVYMSNPQQVSVAAASSISGGSATLNGTVINNDESTTVTFHYGTTTSYGNSIAATPNTLAANAPSTAVSAVISGLTCNTVYHFQVRATNSRASIASSDASFTSEACVIRTLTYNGNGSTTGTVPAAASYTSGTTATLAGNTGSLAKTGFAFAGWNTAADGSGTDYAVGASLTVNASLTLYARWRRTLSYNGNSNSAGTVPAPSFFDTAGTSITIAANTGSLTRSGYSFVGWNTNSAGSGTAYLPGATWTSTASSTVLYAQWVRTYGVLYSGNSATGGSPPADGAAYVSGNTVTVAGNTGGLYRTGYVFNGWNTATNGSGISRAVGSTFTMASSNVTLFARWVPVYTVTYDGNGSTGGSVPTDSGAYQNGATVTVAGNPGNLTRPGYVFSGWNTASTGAGTNRAEGSTFAMGAANVTLYAKWAPLYTVSYDGNGSTGGTAPTDAGSYQSAASVTVAGNAGTLSRSGYTFVGWNTAANGSGTALTSASSFTMGSGNVTLYAQWAQNYSVSYDGNGSDSGTAPVDAAAHIANASVTVAGNSGNLGRAGHLFNGWNTAADGSGTARAAGDSFTMPGANVTLYAQWTPVYTVTYDGNGSTGGSVPTDTASYQSAASVTVAGNSGSLSRSGYSFAGWNTAADGSGTAQAAASSLLMGSANVTLYAQWTALPTYTVTYDGNGSTGGSVPTDAGTYLNAASVTVAANSGNLSRTGYTFAGWNTAADGSGTAQAVASTLLMGSANVTLYAQWTALPAPVTPTTPADPGNPSTISLPSSGATTTASPGQSLVVTNNGSSGSLINLPAPSGNNGVNLALPGNGSVQVSSTSASTQLGVQSVLLPGATSAVSTVTVNSGAATFSASQSGQALASLGNGIVVVSGSNSSRVSIDATGSQPTIGLQGSDTLIVPGGTASVAGTSVNLPAPTGSSASAINVQLGSQRVAVQSGQANSVLTVQVVDIGGVHTPVLAVSGTARISSTDSANGNQPLLTLGNSVVFAGTDAHGQSCQTRLEAASAAGSHTVEVSNCSVRLTSTTLAGAAAIRQLVPASNAFAAVRDGVVWAGETAEFDAAGNLTQAYLGSRNGRTDLPGDVLVSGSGSDLPSPPTDTIAIPRLSGTPERLAGERLDSRLFALVNQATGSSTAPVQNGQGVLSFALGGSQYLSTVPSGRIRIDSRREDGLRLNAEGNVEASVGGLVTTFVPALADPRAFAALLAASQPGASSRQRANGSWLLTTADGSQYLSRPQWVQRRTGSGTSGEDSFSQTEEGVLRYRTQGLEQTLVPDFLDYAALGNAFRSELNDPTLSLLPQMDGTVLVSGQSLGYRLRPQWTLLAPAAVTGKPAWWAEGNTLFLRNADGSAQGFSVLQ